MLGSLVEQIMFNLFQNTAWTESDDSLITIATNTDSSISGSSTSLTFASAANEYVDFSFTGVDMSQWQEIVMWVYVKDQLTADNILRITIDGNDYDYSRSNLRSIRSHNGWKQLVFDCSNMGTIYSIRFTSLVQNLTLFVDYVGYRKVDYTVDIDLILALKNHINLDYDVDATFAAAASAGDTEVTISSMAYLTNNSHLELEDGSGNIEPAQVESLAGTTVTMGTAITGTYSIGDDIRVTCPVRAEDYDQMEPDPICGIKIYDKDTKRTPDILSTKNGPKYVEYLGNLGIIVYIDCSMKKKLLQLCREYDNKYGEEFEFLLDGDKVTAYIEDSTYTPDIIGNNPRMAYYYRIEPQPYSQINFGYTETLTLTVQSEPATDTLES